MRNPGGQLYQAKLISIVSPVYGCVGCLEELVDRISLAVEPTGTPFEIILVDDCGPGNAWERIEELASERQYVKGLKLSRNFGQHSAIAAGLSNAVGDVIVVMDCDLQDVPEEIPNLVGHLTDEVDVVIGERVERKDTYFKRLGSVAFHRILSYLTGVRQNPRTANFGAYKRKVIDAIQSMPESERAFPLLVKWVGFRTIELPVRHAERMEGETSYSFRKLLSLALHIIISYSDKPLRLVVSVGLFFALTAFGLAAFALFRFIKGDIQVAGFTSIVASIWIASGATLMCLGLIGLYIGRLFVESKRRPNYVISKTTDEESQDL